MAARDDGEFELILGNKQLLSVLFIVIILLGVFFTMGFLAGRSTGAGATVAQKRPADQTPLAVDAPNPSRETIPTASEPEPTDKPVEKAAEPPVEPQPAPPRKEPERPAPAKKEPAKHEEAKKEAHKAEPVRSQGGFVQAPPSGTYLQAAATRRADAESMLAEIGSKKGLRGYITASPKTTELFRVLIGPLSTNESIATARAKLGELGIKSPYIVKY
ncbi:SPOR domain-containing protein [uncultured Paludibaculum sp.]|uniref:SPOR domain-containing protein n=1 Tax=uncultured Paludibaculum sp. TaxID=1765020 RepID=UPI002AAC179B|nr:SPOR domain-containing protein [uncultured Paludibaculum sp.]